MVDVFTNNHFDRVTTFVEYQQRGETDELSPACVPVSYTHLTLPTTPYV